MGKYKLLFSEEADAELVYSFLGHYEK